MFMRIYLAYNRHDQSTTEHDSENISRSTKVKSFKKAINKLDKVVFMSAKKRKIDVEKGGIIDEYSSTCLSNILQSPTCRL
jgi:hypothetical protein